MFVIGTRGTSLERTVEQFHIRFEANDENFARQMKTWGRGGFWQEYAIFFYCGYCGSGCGHWTSVWFVLSLLLGMGAVQHYWQTHVCKKTSVGHHLGCGRK